MPVTKVFNKVRSATWKAFNEQVPGALVGAILVGLLLRFFFLFPASKNGGVIFSPFENILLYDQQLLHWTPQDSEQNSQWRNLWGEGGQLQNSSFC